MGTGGTENVWIAFPEISPQATAIMAIRAEGQFSRRDQYRGTQGKQIRPSGKQSLFCRLHGNTNHDTKNCLTIKKIEQMGWKREYRANSATALEPALNENPFTTEDENKSDSEYVCYSNCLNNKIETGTKENPFYTEIQVENRRPHRCLIDSGADISIINRENIPQNVQLGKTTAKTRSISDNDLKVVGKIKSKSNN
jgi:hypothetical protein